MFEKKTVIDHIDIECIPTEWKNYIENECHAEIDRLEGEFDTLAKHNRYLLNLLADIAEKNRKKFYTIGNLTFTLDKLSDADKAAIQEIAAQLQETNHD